MQIKLRNSPEPLSPNAEKENIILARSKTYNIFLRELDRYVTQSAGGRSILVSGHRGSGKTTMVHSAIKDLIKEYKRVDNTDNILVVELHGPDLFAAASMATSKPKPVKPEVPAESAAPAAQQKESGKKDDSMDLVESSLKHITISLYRAFSKALIESFVEENTVEYNELTAMLTLELDNGSEPSVFRQFWAKAGRLKTARGYKELVALTNAVLAYRMVSGKLTQNVTKKDTLNQSESKSISSNDEKQSDRFKNLTELIFGLMAGGAVGSAIIFKDDGIQSYIAIIAGIITAFLSIFLIKFTYSKSRNQEEVRSLTFIPDYSVSTLDRQIPKLVDRIREAGYTPIFVVDELDKVMQPPYKKFSDLVGHLKHFVAERSFFCFLTDRDYYDFLYDLSQNDPYPKAHTYFTHRLFVLYSPSDFHEYLISLYEVGEEVSKKTKRPLPQGSENTAQIEAVDIHLLNYWLLHKAKLHPFDLRRQLSKLSHAEGTIDMPVGIRSYLGYRFPIMIQLIIESLLNGTEIEARLEQDPHFGQLIYDTLYYPSRIWEKGEEELDINEGPFMNYLLSRMNGNTKVETIQQAEEAENSESEINQNDFEFLHDLLKSLIKRIVILSDEEKKKLSEQDYQTDYEFSQIVEERKIQYIKEINKIQPSKADEVSWTNIIGIISPLIGDQEELKLFEELEPNRYRWRYDAFGRKLKAGVPLKIDSLIQDYRELLIPFFEFINNHFNINQFTLNQAGILNQTPDWTSAQESAKRLEGFIKTRELYDLIDSDTQLLEEYTQMIKSSGEVIAKGILLASEISMVAGQARDETDIYLGMNAIGHNLRLINAFLAPDKLEQLFGYSKVIDNLNLNSFSLEKNEFPKWEGELKTKLSELKNEIKTIEIQQISKLWWTLWHERVEQIANHQENEFRPMKIDLLAHAIDEPLSKKLNPDPYAINLIDWSTTLSSAVSGTVPFFMALPALYKLGLIAQRENLTKLPLYKNLTEENRTAFSTIANLYADSAKIFAPEEYIICIHDVLDFPAISPSNLHGILYLEKNWKKKENVSSVRVLIKMAMPKVACKKIAFLTSSDEVNENEYLDAIPEKFSGIGIVWVSTSYINEIDTKLPVLKDEYEIDIIAGEIAKSKRKK